MQDEAVRVGAFSSGLGCVIRRDGEAVELFIETATPLGSVIALVAWAVIVAGVLFGTGMIVIDKIYTDSGVEFAVTGIVVAVLCILVVVWRFRLLVEALRAGPHTRISSSADGLRIWPAGALDQPPHHWPCAQVTSIRVVGLPPGVNGFQLGVHATGRRRFSLRVLSRGRVQTRALRLILLHSLQAFAPSEAAEAPTAQTPAEVFDSGTDALPYRRDEPSALVKVYCAPSPAVWHELRRVLDAAGIQCHMGSPDAEEIGCGVMVARADEVRAKTLIDRTLAHYSTSRLNCPRCGGDSSRLDLVDRLSSLVLTPLSPMKLFGRWRRCVDCGFEYR